MIIKSRKSHANFLKDLKFRFSLRISSNPLKESERDELIKFIRKSASLNVLSSRILAARGYLLLLQISKVETAVEQSQCPQLGSKNGNISVNAGK